MKRPTLILTGAALAVFFLAAVLLFSGLNPVQAAPPVQATEPPPASGGSGNDTCLGCHGQPGMQQPLPSGEALYLTVDPTIFSASVHGQQDIQCVQCHTNITGYPHPPLEAQNRRDVSLQMYETCKQCHTSQASAMTNDVHQLALSGDLHAGQPNPQAAVCTDCHGAHDVQPPDQPRARIPQTCQRCHSQIYTLYKDSVHGSALIGEGNPDVPSCVDCHNAHNVQGPSNSAFRLFSPNICARCHANDDLMGKYGINTDVFDTYLADFHGTTVELFQALAPGQETNKPVCADCHGVHDIKQADDPNSAVMKQNLLETCQKCHPGANVNFPSAWLSHYKPSPTRHPFVYYVNLFYNIFIPTVLGGMVVFVISDAARRWVAPKLRKDNKGKRK